MATGDRRPTRDRHCPALMEVAPAVLLVPGSGSPPPRSGRAAWFYQTSQAAMGRTGLGQRASDNPRTITAETFGEQFTTRSLVLHSKTHLLVIESCRLISSFPVIIKLSYSLPLQVTIPIFIHPSIHPSFITHKGSTA